MFKEMVLEKSGNRLNIPLMIMTLGASMLLAYSTLGGGPSPLNCALAAAVPPIYSAAVLAGSLITYLASGGVICGVLTTAGIFLSSSKLGLPAAFLGIAGFAAGFAADYSKVSVGAAFLTVNFCGQLLTGMNDA